MERLQFLYAENNTGITHFEYNKDFGSISKELEALQQCLRAHICKGGLTPNNFTRQKAFDNMKDNKLQSMDSLTANHETIFSTTDLAIGGYSFMDFLNGTLIQDDTTFKPILSFHFQDSLKIWREKMEKYRKEQTEIKERI